MLLKTQLVWTEKHFPWCDKKTQQKPHHKSIPKTAVHRGMNARLFSGPSCSFSLGFMPCCFVPTAALGPWSCKPCGRCKGAQQPSHILQSLTPNELFHLKPAMSRWAARGGERAFRNALTHAASYNSCAKYSVWWISRDTDPIITLFCLLFRPRCLHRLELHVDFFMAWNLRWGNRGRLPPIAPPFPLPCPDIYSLWRGLILYHLCLSQR